jgi:hypothetical protein
VKATIIDIHTLADYSVGLKDRQHSPRFLPLPIDWRWVEDKAEFMCSQVAITERLLHETLALVGCNIRSPI